MPAPLLPKSEVVDRVMAVFRERGFEGATLARIAEATGLGKASLYHYFPGGKEDMGNVVLDVTESWMQEHVLGPLGEETPPRQRIGRMLKSLDALYDGGNAACLLGTLTVGDSRTLFRKRLQRIFDAWIDALAGALRDAGSDRRAARERAEDTVARIEGALILAQARGDTGPFRRLLRQLGDELAP
ncbi:MAG TPA: TetR/AcrR family transcriptional regulator [Gammaproteobacteria bacterium]